MKNQLIAFGLFSNLRGLEIGAASAGFLTPFSTDVEPETLKVFNHLNKDSHERFLIKDIEQLHFSDIETLFDKVEAGIKKYEIDLLVGGPPCFGITLLNTNHRSVFHTLNYLMLEMLRLVSEMQPKVVVIEQVPALLHRSMRPFFLLFISTIEKLGNYHWDYKVLNAEEFGCYQRRKRVIFMLVRKDIGVPSFPIPNKVDLTKQSAFSVVGAEYIRTRMYQKKSKYTFRLTNGRTKVFPTLTSSKVEIFRDGLWQELTIDDRLKLAHMDRYDLKGVVPETTLKKMLGMMVIPLFAEVICRHVHDVILAA